MKKLLLALTLAACAPSANQAATTAAADTTRNVNLAAMGPLTIDSEADWSAFAADVAAAKTLGITAISVDVWWGQVEKDGDEQFDWSWVDRAAQTITSAGLKWRPVLAFHACGTNVGDTCNVPIPSWIFDRYPANELRYVSAEGHTSNEVLSAWATPIVLEQYRQFFVAFANHYSALASQTSGIAIGLGPASELRYPSYDAHDPDSGYPGPGVLQASSPLAQQSFAAHGGDFSTWYRDSLLDHGRLVLGAAADVFQASSFNGVRLSARIPGVHWRAGSDRRAELSAGVISNDTSDGHGYGPIVDMIAGLRARPDHPNIALEYTCLEMPDGVGGPAVASLAESLVFWVAQRAHDGGVPIGGENALAGGLASTDGWDHIANAVTWSFYDDLTFLRVHDIVQSEIARERVSQLR